MENNLSWLIVVVVSFFVFAQVPTLCRIQSVTDDEILQVSEALWKMDDNRAKSGDVIVDLQSRARYGSTLDVSPRPFFQYVNPELLRRPTFRSLISLLDNYEKRQGRREIVTSQERREVSHFLDQILQTRIGRHLYRFLHHKRISGCGDLSTFKDTLFRMWFSMYSRRNRIDDSCGFEHVFVGELQSSRTTGEQKVAGLHNWIQFYLQERRGDLNYYGYIRHKKPGIYSTRFAWHGLLKPVGGSIVGTSPELELALFTLCHVARPEKKCHVRLTDQSGSVVNAAIKTWTWASRINQGTGTEFVSSGYFLV